MTAENEGPLGKAPDFSVGVSDTVLLLVSGAGFVFLAVTVYSIVLAKLKSSEEIEEEEKDYDANLANADVSTLNRAQRRARARHIMKQQRRITPAGGALGENGDIDDNNQVQENDASHLSRKDRQKAAKSAEKEERRLYENERQQQQQEAQKLAQQEKKERGRLMTEKTDEERQARYEQRMAEEMADYEKWRTFLASPDGSNVLAVKEWIAELQKSRLVYVKKLAERFDISRETVKERIQHMLASSRVTGIQDGDRFIYLSMQEMTDVASFLQARDKTSLEQIVEKIEEIIGD
jgi:hypothetical protein